MEWLSNWVNAAVRWFLDLVIAVFKLLGVIVIDMVCYVIDGLGEVVVWALNLVDLTPVTTWADGMWAQIPLEMLDFAKALGLEVCMSIILAAVIARLILQLIPFTRLGS